MKTKKRIIILVIIVALVLGLSPGCSGSASVTLNQSTMNMEMYEVVTLQAKVRGAAKSAVVRWHSSDSAVAKVEDGVVTSLKVGTAIVTATIEGVTARCEINVERNRKGRALSVNKSSVALEVGEETSITATFKENGTPVNAPVYYESIDPSIAKIDHQGKITAVSRGAVVVSAYVYYQGQHFYKDVVVRSMVLANENKDFVQEEGEGALQNYSGDVTLLGFSSGTKVQKLTSDGLFSSRIFVKDLFQDNKSSFDKLVSKVRFESAPNMVTLWLANYKKGVKANENLISSDNALLFYDSQGKLPLAYNSNEIYTMVVDLHKTGNGKDTDGGTVYEYGLQFGLGTLYLGETLVCSQDYYINNYSLETPPQVPELGFIYGETGVGVDVGSEELPQFEKYWVGQSSGTKEDWDNSIWDKRVTIGGISVNKYRDFNFMSYDILFTDVNFRSILLWTGGYSITINKDGTLAREGGAAAEPNELSVTDELGNEVALGELEANKVYRIKVYIQRKNTQNVAFGISVNSPTANAFYLSNPSFSMA